MFVEELKRNNGEVYLKISYDAGLNCVIDEWSGSFGTQNNFKKGLERIVETIRDKKCTNWLANLSDLKGSFDSSSDWLTSVLMPEAVKAGLKNEAVILPKNIFAKLSTKDAINEIEMEGLAVNYFEDVKEGLAWLQSKSRIKV